MVRSSGRFGWRVWCLVRRRPRVHTATDGCRVLNLAIRPAQAVAMSSFVKGPGHHHINPTELVRNGIKPGAEEDCRQ